MTKLPATRGDVYAIVVSAYEDEYKDLAEAWRALETKAQGAAAIGGVFLAAGATLSKTLLTGVPRWAAVTFAASFALLIAAIGFAVRALRVTITARRPEGAEIARLAGPALKAPEQALADAGARLLNDQLDSWKATDSELATAVKKKATAVETAQTLLFWAALIFATFAAVTILHSSFAS